MNENQSKSLFKTLFSSDIAVKAMFITSIAGISAIISFSYALVSTKKKDNTSCDKEIVKLHQTGSQLAFRALKWGTFYAVTGCSLIIYGGWKLSGAKDMTQFRMKVGSLFPVVPKNNPPQSKTEFGSLTEFMQYLNDEFSTKDVHSENNISDEQNTEL